MSLTATRLPLAAARSSQRPSHQGDDALRDIAGAAAPAALSMSSNAVTRCRTPRNKRARRPLADTATAGKSRTQPTSAIQSP